MNDQKILEYFKTANYSGAIKALHPTFKSVKKLVIANQGNSQDAEDIYQEALIILCQNCRKEGFQLSSSFSTYVIGVARRIWLAELRKRGKYQIGLEESVEKFPVDLPDEQTEKRRSLAEASIQLLGKKCQSLLEMFYFRKLKLEKIAAELGLANERVAKNQKYRCLEKARYHFIQLQEVEL